MAHRVVVTGWGVLSSIGHDAASYWANLSKGVCGIAPAMTIPTTAHPEGRCRGQGLRPAQHFDERQVAMLDRVSQFARDRGAGGDRAFGLTFERGLSEQTATIIGYRRRRAIDPGRELQAALSRQGQAAASAHHPEADGERAGEPDFHGLRVARPAFVVASACASATHAIGLAFQMVRSGRCRRRGDRRRGCLHRLRHDEGLGGDARDGARHLPAVLARPQGPGDRRGRGRRGDRKPGTCARRVGNDPGRDRRASA